MEPAPRKPSRIGPIKCIICKQPIDLYSETIVADENGYPVHSECYVNRLAETAKLA